MLVFNPLESIYSLPKKLSQPQMFFVPMDTEEMEEMVSRQHLAIKLSCTVFSRTFSIVLRPSRDIPACSRPFLCVLWLFPSVPSLSVVFWFVPSSIPSVFFCLFPSISLFRLVSFQFSILGSDRSESGSLLLICLHFCSATIPFPVDLHVFVLLSYDLHFPFELWSASYCSVLYINLASYVVIR